MFYRIFIAAFRRNKVKTKRMKIIRSMILFFAIIAATTAAAQNPSASAARNTGRKLAPRSALVPYPSREAALAGNREASPWYMGLADWNKDTLEGDTRYSARVKIPRSWEGRAVILRTGGVTGSFGVEVNGIAAGESQSGMSRAEFDITPLCRQDYNDIAITILGNSPAREVENHRDHSEPAIERAALISQPMVSIRDIVAESSVNGTTGRLSLSIIMNSRLRNPKECTVSYELISPEGKVVAQASRRLTTGRMSEDTLRFAASIPDVKRWNHRSPHLYTIVAKTLHEGRYTEHIAAEVGFRSVSHLGGRLFIDGEEIAIRDTVFGWQGSRASTEAGLRELRERGYNCVKVPGYPQPDDFYSACDEVGMYVCDVADVNTSAGPREITRGGNRSNDPAWLGVFLSRAMEMFRCSRIHPSVVMLCPAAGSPNGYCLYESYLALKEASGLPVVYPDAAGQWNNDGVID